MLLLVLIFVLAAFALLLVALVTGTAAWAWISVVVSVAAAGVLVYDWAQRRAAVRTSGGAQRAPGVPGGPPPGMPMHVEETPTTAIPVRPPVMEPATEVFPALRPDYAARPSAADDAQTSVISMPSGSSGRPSGAQSDVTDSDESSSRNVTAAVDSSAAESEDTPSGPADAPSGERSGSGFEKAAAAGGVVAAAAGAAAVAKAASSGPGKDAEDHGGAGSTPAADVPDTTAEPRGAHGGGEPPARAGNNGDDYAQWQPKSGEPAAPGSARASGAPAADQGVTPGRPATDQPRQPATDKPRQPVADRPAAASGAPAQSGPGAPPAQQPAAASSGRAPSGPSGPGQSPPNQSPAGQPGRTAPGDADRTTAISSAGVAGAAAAGLAAAKAAERDQPAGKPPVHDQSGAADRTTAIPIAGAQRAGQPPAQDTPVADATQALTPVKGGPPPEPGEERPDAAALATVSTLSDEVLVIDEHPRFHLAGCRALAGSETIPLPAKEAIEYGFSPCSVCSPIRVLAGRNRAASSS